MKCLIQCVGLAFALAGTPTFGGPPQYAVRFLGEASKVEGINASGVIAGWRLSRPARNFGAGPDQPYVLLSA